MVKVKNKLLIGELFFVFIVLFSGFGVQSFREQSATIILFVFSLYVFIVHKIRLNFKLVLVLFIWFFYVLALTISFKEFHPYFASIYPIYIFSSFILSDIFKDKLFHNFENVIYKLSVISLIFFIIEYVLGSELFQSLFKPFSLNNEGSVNILVYTSNFRNVLNFRNSGFCWEPGPFANFLILALFIHIIRCNFYVFKNIRFWVFIVTLISTKSTSGYFMMFVLFLILFYKHQKFKKLIGFVFPLLLFLGYQIYLNSSILSSKLEEDAEQMYRFSTITEYKAQNQDGTTGFGRTVSYYVAYIDFMNNPILGYGGHDEATYLKQNNLENINTSSGLGNLIAQYGIFGIISIFVLIITSGQYISTIYRQKIISLWVIIIIGISISVGMIFTPIVTALLFAGIFTFTSERQVFK